MKIHIKNMVCARCIMAVDRELDKLGLGHKHIGLGEVTLERALSGDDKLRLQEALDALGFELIDDRRGRIIEGIKKEVIDLVHRRDNDIKTNLSDHLSRALGQDYGQLSKLFAEVEGTTLEKYFIAQKIERVKELLVYDELSLAEIAQLLHYSSAAYLSNQFKKVTGLTPSHFKALGQERRIPLDKL